MVEISGIRDGDSLKAWLEARPGDDETRRREAVQVAHRAAMRVLPVFWAWPFSDRAHKHDLTALPILRCALISGVAAIGSTPEIRFAAADAAAAAADAWDAVRSDCEMLVADKLLARDPLWPGGENPLQETWNDAAAHLRDPATPDGPWDFWLNWYEDALAGREPDRALLEKIALIPSGDWEKGAAHVNALIARMVADHRAHGAGAAARTDAIRQAVARNRGALAMQLDALWTLIDEEHERQRGRNPRDEMEEAEKARLLDLLARMREAVAGLHALLPTAGAPSTGEAAEMEGLVRLHARHMGLFLRENVDTNCRVVLIAGTTGVLSAMGVPALMGLMFGGMAYGGTKLGDLREMIGRVRGGGQ